MYVQPYLFFDGRCEEAIEFYRKAVDAQVEMLMRFKDNPDPQPGSMPPGAENKVMHVSMRIGDTSVMASDGHATGKPKEALNKSSSSRYYCLRRAERD
jgi:PhnB protein